jgi:predicted DNA-binding ribbon-helix-helix protein
MRVDNALLTQVKEIAKRRGVTVTHLIDQHFRDLVLQEQQTVDDLGVEQA